MNAHTDFTNAVLKHFSFLETDYAMRREPLQTEGAAVWVSFANIDVRVIVETDGAGYCSVSLVDLRHIKKDPMERSEFDLDEVVTLSGGRPPRADKKPPLNDAIGRAAETLKRVGDAVLKGDFAALHAKQAKFVDTTRKLQNQNPINAPIN